MRNWTKPFLALALVALTAVTFWPATDCGFVNLDDNDYVSGNAHVQAGLNAEGVAWAFTTGRTANWHPLTWLSLMLDRSLFGSEAWGYHVTNLALHCANAVLVFLILASMTGATIRSWLVATL